MQSILFLCHRLPWPPDKGDKIRSYHVLRRLAENYSVYLGTFVDDPDDWRYLDEVKAVCASVCVRPLKPWRARTRALVALARGEALTPGFYRDHVLQSWVDCVVADCKPQLALCYSSGVASFVMRHPEIRRVMDFVDADSDKWRQYAEDRRGLARAVYRREARLLAKFEHAVAERFDASLFVSEAEAGFFRSEIPVAAGKVHGVANGVDVGYWNPEREYENPYPAGARAVVFAGAMDYRANVDAVCWFANAVWPRIRAARPEARFYVVGSRPAPDVVQLGRIEGVVVTGRVADMRPYVAHAHAVTAPLRIARGIQNKVLEALAMEKVVLATPAAWEGIGDFEGREGCISNSPDALAAEALRWLEPAQPTRVAAGRAMVRARFEWARNLDAYESVLRGATSRRTLASAMTAAEACA